MNEFNKGVKAGIPIGLGYLSVSIGFGIFSVANGLYWWQAVLISMLCLTSAGQLAGVRIMAAGGSYISTLVSQLTINIRYSFMSISLSQKLDKRFSVPRKAVFGFFMTDEIFAVASTRDVVTTSFFAGLSVMPFIGWTVGTLTGALLGNILNAAIMSAMGLAIYGMFVAIVVPEMKENRNVLMTACIAMAVSCIFYYVPILNMVSIGISISISALTAAFIMAVLKPLPDITEGKDTEVHA
ncbi:MAG TPA: branched-chain amino acid ABC transporter permease [Lachnospiraceae bacterium]|nr:branched-chain amino acid ABC transporter permease [Lachnospiraceae bacterium]